MGRKTTKNKKHNEDKNELSIKLHLKDYLYSWFFVIVSIIAVLLLLSFYFTKLLIIDKQMLFWFFASTSQSMAALFAVAGIFAVFRFQAQENKLRNLYDSNKRRFTTHNWSKYIGDIEAEFWSDNEFLDKAKKVLEKTSVRPIKQKIQGIISEIEKQENIKNRILNMLIIPLFSVALTFFAAIVFLPISAQIENRIIGLIVLLIMLVLVAFSITSIFKYIIKSISFN